MKNYINNKKAFLSILGLLMAVGIVLFLGLITLNTYFKQPSIDKETRKSMLNQGIDTSSRQAVYHSTKKKIKDIEKRILKREGELFKSLPH